MHPLGWRRVILLRGERLTLRRKLIHFAFVRIFHALLGLALLAFIMGCSPQVRLLNVKSEAPDYKVRELQVTGRPIIAKHDLYPALRIEGFKKPDGETYFINSPISDEELLRKLDPKKSYRFRLFTTDQTRGKNDHIHHAHLSKVEDGGQCIIDASICDVHHVIMDFVPAQNESWWLQSPNEKRDLEFYHNHGRAFPSCCSGGLIRWHTWRCPACAKKVDSFKSKYYP